MHLLPTLDVTVVIQASFSPWQMCEMVTRTSRLTKTVLSSRKEISRDYVPSDGVNWLVSAFFLFLAIRLIMLSMYLLSILGTISCLRSIGDCSDCRDDNGLMSTVSRTPRLHHRKYKLCSRVRWYDTCCHACKMHTHRLVAAAACTVIVAGHVGFETISHPTFILGTSPGFWHLDRSLYNGASSTCESLSSLHSSPPYNLSISLLVFTPILRCPSPALLHRAHPEKPHLSAQKAVWRW